LKITLPEGWHMKIEGTYSILHRKRQPFLNNQFMREVSTSPDLDQVSENTTKNSTRFSSSTST
jgi:hypothetical protein